MRTRVKIAIEFMVLLDFINAAISKGCRWMGRIRSDI